MAMTDKPFADQLMEAAERVDKLSRAELQRLLRGAALRVDNKSQEVGTTVLPSEMVEHVDEFAASKHISRDAAVAIIVRDWLIGSAFLEGEPELDEDTPTEGEA